MVFDKMIVFTIIALFLLKKYGLVVTKFPSSKIIKMSAKVINVAGFNDTKLQWNFLEHILFLV